MTYDQYSQNWIAKKKSKIHWAHDYLEKPAMFGELPDLEGKTILCLGCGSGEECEYLLTLNPAKIIAVDSSQKLIDWGKMQYESTAKIEFFCSTLEELILETESVDFVFSSLTMHYIEDWTTLFAKIKTWIKPNPNLECQMIFSCHHPIKWGAQASRNKEFNEFKLGYNKNKNNDKSYEVYGDYLTPRAIDEKLFGQLEIVHYHKSISTMWTQIQASGLTVNQIIEPLPLEITKTTKPDFYQTYSKIPLFIIWKLSV
jgi:trans-aconitate methyltransferase